MEQQHYESEKSRGYVSKSHFFSVKFPHVHPQCFSAEFGWRESNIKQRLDTQKPVTLVGTHLKYLTLKTTEATSQLYLKLASYIFALLIVLPITCTDLITKFCNFCVVKLTLIKK